MSGVNLLSSGKVKRLVVVLFRIAPSHRPFALNEDYPGLVKKEMEALGLKEKDFKIIVTHIHSPLTLVSAKAVMENIAQDNIKSAILLSSGFHTRRSYLVYQHVSNPFHIKIYPSACFNSYKLDHWWVQDGGFRDFALEFIKLVYYLAGGYIPLKLFINTNDKNKKAESNDPALFSRRLCYNRKVHGKTGISRKINTVKKSDIIETN